MCKGASNFFDKMSAGSKITKLEDRSSDTSESEDESTSRISLSHQEDKSFLKSSDEEPPKPVLAKKSLCVKDASSS